MSTMDAIVAQGEAEEARMKEEGRVEQRKEVAELKDLGNGAFNAGDFDKALELYSEALEVRLLPRPRSWRPPSDGRRWPQALRDFRARRRPAHEGAPPQTRRVRPAAGPQGR